MDEKSKVLSSIDLLKEENNTLREKLALSNLIVSDLEGQQKKIIIHNSQELKKRNEKLELKNKLLLKTKKQLDQKNILLEKSSENKDYLVKEIHHRVKNNLQLLSSLLSIQLRDGKTYDKNTLIKDIINRIVAISSLHTMLCQNFGTPLINFEEYIKQTFNPMIQSRENDTLLVVNESPLELNVENCTYLGLILNELITNSLKHGWKATQIKEKTISIFFNFDNDKFKLHYSDNGKGDSLKEKTKSFGKNIISILVTNQMNGDYKEYNEEGYNMKIEIPSDELK